MELILKPVGIVQSDIKEPSLRARSGDLNWEGKEPPSSHSTTNMSQIVIDLEYAGILDGIEDFSHLLVLYWAHKVSATARKLRKVHPIGRKDLPLVGVFATCSPARPNPVLAIVVRLVKREGPTLHVEGLDAIDGSPVIDIKPYLPSYYSVPDAKLSDWMEKLIEELWSD